MKLLNNVDFVSLPELFTALRAWVISEDVWVLDENGERIETTIVWNQMELKKMIQKLNGDALPLWLPLETSLQIVDLWVKGPFTFLPIKNEPVQEYRICCNPCSLLKKILKNNNTGAQ
jgi:hypothetical protein